MLNIIKIAISELKNHYLSEGFADTVRGINNGECYSFASDLIEKISDTHGDSLITLNEVEYREYSDFYGGVDTPTPEIDNDKMHVEGLIALNSPLPEWLSIKDANTALGMGGGGHGFISAKIAGKTLYFDSLNPDGVETIFDLMISKFYIAAYNGQTKKADTISAQMELVK